MHYFVIELHFSPEPYTDPLLRYQKVWKPQGSSTKMQVPVTGIKQLSRYFSIYYHCSGGQVVHKQTKLPEDRSLILLTVVEVCIEAIKLARYASFPDSEIEMLIIYLETKHFRELSELSHYKIQLTLHLPRKIFHAKTVPPPIPAPQQGEYSAYLKIEESLAKPVMHDSNLCRITFQRPPDIFCHHCLNQQTKHQHWQIVRSKQKGCQQNQSTVHFP